jgi:hypothetical protein
MTNDDNFSFELADHAGPPLDPEPASSFRDRPWAVVLAAAVVVVLAAGVWYWWSRPEPEPPVSAQQAEPEPTVQAPQPALGQGEADIELPQLDDFDGYLRPLLAGLSSRPELAALLTSDNLLRRFVVSVENIARGVNPTSQVGPLTPKTRFSVERPEEVSRVRADSFRRYDGVAATMADLDADGLAELYGRLKPRLEEAYAELGTQGQSFDEVMEKALHNLLATPVAAATGEVRPAKGLTYAWTNEATENLSDAQKQLLRMGPRNGRIVQAKLREFAVALGIPPSRLPPAPAT